MSDKPIIIDQPSQDKTQNKKILKKSGIDKLKGIVKRIKIFKALGIKSMNQKLNQEDVNLNKYDDYLFIIALLQKEDRAQMEIEFLKKAFKKMKFFDEHEQVLSPEIYDIIFQHIKYLKRRANEILFQFGDKDHKYFIVLSGTVTLLVPNHKLVQQIKSLDTNTSIIKKKNRQLLSIYYQSLQEKQDQIEWHEKEMQKKMQKGVLAEQQNYENFLKTTFPDFDIIRNMHVGDSFGEIAVINRTQRTGTIICKSDCEFMYLEANSFDLILKEQERKILRMKYQFLNKMNETYQIPEARKNDLIHSITTIKPRLFEIIYKEGDESEYIYYVNQGEVELSKHYKNNTKSIEEELNQKHSKNQESITVRISLSTQGCVFGKEDIIERCKRTLTAKCNSRINEIFLLPKDVKYLIFKKIQIYFSCTRDTQQTPTVNTWRQNKISQSEGLSMRLMSKSEEKIKEKNTKSYNIESQSFQNHIKLQLANVSNLVDKKDKVNQILNTKFETSPQRAFLNEAELKEQHTSFPNRINAIQEGFFFCDLPQTELKLQQIQRTQLLNKRQDSSLSALRKTLSQSSHIGRRIQTNSQGTPLTIIPGRIIEKTLGTTHSEKNSSLHNRVVIKSFMQETERKNKNVNSMNKSIDIPKITTFQNQNTQTKQESSPEIINFQLRGESSTIDQSMDFKRKRILYPLIFRKVEERKQRYLNQISSQQKIQTERFSIESQMVLENQMPNLRFVSQEVVNQININSMGCMEQKMTRSRQRKKGPCPILIRGYNLQE